MSGGSRGTDWRDVESRLLSGDRLAFLELSRLITRVLARFRAYDFSEEWDDLRQEVSMAIVENARRGRLRDPVAFVGYVRSITRNKLMDRLQRRLRLREREVLCWDAETERGAPLEATDDPELRRDLLEALARLPEQERRAVEEVYVRGRSYQEAADATGLPLGTLKRRLRTGLAALRAWLKECHDGP
ncbi:MAG: RNA polymerase sigma factor [Myxococcota bacterium]